MKGPTTKARRVLPVLPFLFGLGFGVHLDLGGELFASEALAVLATPFVLLGVKTQARTLSRWVALGCAAWALGSGLSGFANGASVQRLVPGLVSIAVLYATVLLALTICKTRRDFEWLGWGLVAGLIAGTKLQPVFYFAESPWKFGYGIPVAIAVALVAARLRWIIIRIGLLLVVAGISLRYDFRSLALVLAAVAITEVVRVVVLSRVSERVSTVKRGSLMVGIVLVAGFAVATVYSTLAVTGALGAEAKSRLEDQGGGAPIYVLLAGRYEIFYSLPAALDRPLIGYGPDPVVAPLTVQRSQQMLADRGLEVQAAQEASNEAIPIHSATMSAWITAGLLGFAGWCLFIGILFRGAISAASSLYPFTYVGTMIYLALWTSFYSPFSGLNRPIVAIALALAIFLAQEMVTTVSERVRHA